MKLFLLLGVLIAEQGFAGWVSGGGHLLHDDGNPWFLQNTNDVSYCVDIDEVNFGANAVQVAHAVDQALFYWQLELGTVEQDYLYSSDQKDRIGVNLGTQAFTQVSCDENPAIRFQFGILSDIEERYLQKPERFVGVTVRTDYDRKKLQGKGFVYISPEKGRLAMQDQNIVDGVWTRNAGKRLELVLIHELGHVFGLPHNHQGSNIMAHDFPMNIASLPDAGIPSWGKLKPNVFNHHTYFTVTKDGFKSTRAEPVNEVLGLPVGWDLLQIQFSMFKSLPRMVVWGGEGGSVSSMKIIGTANMNASSGDSLPRVQLYLTDEQTVFPSWVASYKYHDMARSEKMIYTGVYQVAGEQRSMIVLMDAHQLSIGGADQYGTVHPRVFSAEAWRTFINH